MLNFNLDECLFYTYDEESDADVLIDKESILTYLDYPISFDGEIAKSFTLRKFRGMLTNYPYLLLPYTSFKDFLRLTQNMGFKVVKEEGFERIIIGKKFNIIKSELTLLEQTIIEEDNIVSTLNGFKITKAKFVRKYKDIPDINIRVDCYARGEVNENSKSYSLSTEKIKEIYDLPIKIMNDRYVEYQDKCDEERTEIISHEKLEDRYSSESSLTLKDLLDAIDIDIEFWDDEIIDSLTTAIKEQEKGIEKYNELDKENREKINNND